MQPELEAVQADARMELLPWAVLLDMDGTLIDSEPLWLEAETETMARMGCTWGIADQKQCLGGPMSRVVSYMRSQLTEEQRTEFHEQMVHEWLVDAVTAHYERAIIAWMPGARELILDAQALGIPMALVTNSPRNVVEAVLRPMIRDLDFNPFVREFVGDEIENPKPHPDPFQLAAEALGAEPAFCLAIEDSPTGIGAALAAGCKVIAVPHLAPIGNIPGLQQVTTLLGHNLASLWQAAAYANE